MTKYVEVTPADNFDEKMLDNKEVVNQLFTESELSAFKTSIEKLKQTQIFFPDTTVVTVKELKNGVQVEWVNKQDLEETGKLSTIGLLFGKHILKPDIKDIDEDSQRDIESIAEGDITDIYLSAIKLKDKYIPEYEIYGKEIENMKANNMTDYVEYLVLSKVSEDRYKSFNYWIAKHKSGVESRLNESLYLTKAQYDVIKEKIKM